MSPATTRQALQIFLPPFHAALGPGASRCLIEQARRELPKDQASRACELAAYFSHCGLQAVHEVSIDAPYMAILISQP